MEFREYLGFNPVDVKESAVAHSHSLSNNVKAKGLKVDIEALHFYPYATRNDTRYYESAMRESLHKWTYPYNIPVIKHHNDEDGETIGRVINAEIKESQRLPGTKALVLTADILTPDAQEEVKNGLLDTVSIGARGDEVRCSICGQDLANDGLCEHARGTKYDGEMCYWDFKKLEPKELSYVIVPSDAYAKNIKVYDDNAEPAQVEPVLPISSLEGEHDGNKIVVKEHMEKEPKVIPAEVEAKESAEVTPAPAEETETPAKVEEPTEVKESEDTKFEELSAKVQELIEAKEQVEKDYKHKTLSQSMKKQDIHDFNIAELDIRIIFEGDGTNNISLIPSFSPFVTNEPKGDRLFTFTVLDELEPIAEDKLDNIRNDLTNDNISHLKETHVQKLRVQIANSILKSFKDLKETDKRNMTSLNEWKIANAMQIVSKIYEGIDTKDFTPQQVEVVNLIKDNNLKEAGMLAERLGDSSNDKFLKGATSLLNAKSEAQKADAIAQIYDAENSGNKEAQRVMNFYRKGQSLNKTDYHGFKGLLGRRLPRGVKHAIKQHGQEIENEIEAYLRNDERIAVSVK